MNPCNKIFFSLLIILLLVSQPTYCSSRIIKHIKHMNRDKQQLDSIFSTATIQKTQSQTKLYLSDRIVSLLSVPDVMQATDYTCGPASLLGVLSYYQLQDQLRESDIAKRAKTNQQYGTSPENLYALIRSLGISAEMKQYMTLTDLEQNVRNNHTTIILFQAWADPGTEYKNDWADGHYVVVIGYDKDYLYFEDPWILGSIGYIPRSQFLNRWHDIVSGTRKVYNLGIVVKSNQKPKPVIVKLQ